MEWQWPPRETSDLGKAIQVPLPLTAPTFCVQHTLDEPLVDVLIRELDKFGVRDTAEEHLLEGKVLLAHFALVV